MDTYSQIPYRKEILMSAGIYDIVTLNDVDFELSIQYTNYNDIPINVTGKTFIFSVKRSYLNIQDDVFSIYSSGNHVEGVLPYPNSDNEYGTLEVTAASGELVLSINKYTLSDMTPGSYFYSLKMVGSSTEIILRGKFDVEGF